MGTVDQGYLKRAEGLRLFEYDDKTGHRVDPRVPLKGNRTIGWGHMCRTHEHYPNGITEAQAQTIFDLDVGGVLQACHNLIGEVVHDLNDHQITALVSLMFNCGAKPLYGQLGNALRRRDWQAAADAFLLWRHGHGRGGRCDRICRALLDRRQRERALFMSK